MELIETLTRLGGEASITELGEATDLPQPTVHRLLSTLAGQGFIHQLTSRRYILGSRLISIGESAAMQLGNAVQPLLNDAANALGESVNFAIMQQNKIVYIGNSPAPTHSMRAFTEIGRRLHCHNTGVGKAALSLLSDSEVSRVALTSGLPPTTLFSITELDTLLNQLELIRKRGYALDEEEQEVGIRCLAVPLPSSNVPAAVSVSGPTARMTDAFIESAVPKMLEVAREVNAQVSL